MAIDQPLLPGDFQVNSPGSGDLNAAGDEAPADPFVVSAFSPHTSDEDSTETETEGPSSLPAETEESSDDPQGQASAPPQPEDDDSDGDGL